MPTLATGTLVRLYWVVVKRNMAVHRVGIKCIDHRDGYCLLDVRSGANDYHACPPLTLARAGVSLSSIPLSMGGSLGTNTGTCNVQCLC